MSFCIVKSREDVCKERADKLARMKYGDEMKELRAEFIATKNGKLGQKLYRLERQFAEYRRDSYDYFFNNYELADDQYVYKKGLTDKKGHKGSELKDVSNLLIKSLNDLDI
jgi:hypothetical protein